MAILTNDFLTNAVLINAVLTNGFLTNGKTPSESPNVSFSNPFAPMRFISIDFKIKV